MSVDVYCSSIFAQGVKYLGVIITLNIPLLIKDPPISAIHKSLSCGDGPRQRHSAERLLSRMLFFLLLAVVSAGFSVEMNQTSRLLAESGEQCSACDFREHSKQMRLHSIKSQILSILRLEQAPNISRDMIRQLLPKAPPLTQLLDQYDPRVEDEDHATTETIITMATKRNSFFFSLYTTSI